MLPAAGVRAGRGRATGAARRRSATPPGGRPTADLIVFTDDDCRPPPGWLAALVARRASPGAIVQGATQPDPDELGVFHHAPARALAADRPAATRSARPATSPTRARVLEAVRRLRRVAAGRGGGGHRPVPARAGARHPGRRRARRRVTYHAVDWGLRGRLRGSSRWAGMALLVRNHPELRREMPLGGWAWKREHATWLLAAAGARSPAGRWLAAPVGRSAPRASYGTGAARPGALGERAARALRARTGGRRWRCCAARSSTARCCCEASRVAHPTYWPEVRRGAERLAHDIARPRSGATDRHHAPPRTTSTVEDGVEVHRRLAGRRASAPRAPPLRALPRDARPPSPTPP